MTHWWESDSLYLQFRQLRDMPCCGPSRRIQKGLAFAAEQGFWTGGAPPYGLRRLLLDEHGQPRCLLAPGQRKARRKQRVALVLGEPVEVAAVRRMFRMFVELGCSTARIADDLNLRCIAPPRGMRWTAREVIACIRNGRYVAPIAYRRKRKPARGNVDQWVRVRARCVDRVISVEQFRRAQEMLT